MNTILIYWRDSLTSCFPLPDMATTITQLLLINCQIMGPWSLLNVYIHYIMYNIKQIVSL